MVLYHLKTKLNSNSWLGIHTISSEMNERRIRLENLTGRDFGMILRSHIGPWFQQDGQIRPNSIRGQHGSYPIQMFDIVSGGAFLPPNSKARLQRECSSARISIEEVLFLYIVPFWWGKSWATVWIVKKRLVDDGAILLELVCTEGLTPLCFKTQKQELRCVLLDQFP